VRGARTPRARSLLVLALAGAAVALALAAGLMARSPAAPSGTPAASPGPTLSLLDAECAPPRPATFEGRLATGYIGQRECSGKVRNLGREALFDVDVWVDYLDVDGRWIGSCRRSITSSGPLRGGEERTWSATCPVEDRQRDFRVRFTDPSGAPLSWRDERQR
jgi:hypothetical protein